MPERATRRWGPAGGAGRASSDGFRAHLHCSTEPVAIQVYKRGRLCVIAKLVEAQPLGEWVLAMPYRHRQAVQHVSLPPRVLSYARERGARLWIVRLDAQGECYALALEDVERVGWLQRSEGRPEWFVPLSAFEPIAWQDWAYVETSIAIGEEEPEALREPEAVQGVLL